MYTLKVYENYNTLASNKPSCIFEDITEILESVVGGWSFPRKGLSTLVLPSTVIFTLEEEEEDA